MLTLYGDPLYRAGLFERVEQATNLALLQRLGGMDAQTALALVTRTGYPLPVVTDLLLGGNQFINERRKE